MNNPPKYDVRDLAEKWMRGMLTPEEDAYLAEWYNSFDDNEVNLQDSSYEDTDELKTKIYRRLMQRIEGSGVSKSNYWSNRRLILTAGIAVAVFLILTLFIPSRNTNPIQVPVREDVPPGGEKAYITFPNGEFMELNPDQEAIKSQNGKLYYTDGTLVDKSIYETSDTVHQEWLSIATPYGGQYKVILPDGSKVWLNSGSTLQYPTRFNGENREVYFQGEAYFEIAKLPMEDNPQKNTPFTVHMDKQRVEVFGTAFNINGYEDEQAVRTTLVSGSLQVIASDSQTKGDEIAQMLHPNEQAIVYREKLEVQPVNALNEIAWKNGVFLFDNAKLSDILHQLQRWYNVEVDHQSIPNLHFTGSVDRDKPLSTVLEMLELTGNIKFKIKNKKIYVQTEAKTSS